MINCFHGIYSVNPIMTSRSGLLACSNEVLTMIFNDPSLSKKDIKSLRLTSKELHPAATREFAMRYLTEPVVALSRCGLQSLVDICRHPIFGPKIRSIGFLATTLNIRGLQDRVSYMPRDEHDLVEDLAEIIEYASLCKEEQQLKASGDKKKLLANALKAIDHPISVAVINDLESICPDGVIGLPATTYHYDESSDRRVIRSSDLHSEAKSWFTTVEKVIAGMTTKDRIILAGLSIKLRRRSGESPSTSNPNCIKIRALDKIYSNLTTLRLDLNLEALRCPVSSKSWKDLSKMTPKLQEFRFSANYTGTRAVGVPALQRVTKFFDIETAFKLNSLVLENVPCTSGCLLQLLERHKQTLVSLKLSRITLVGDWKACLQLIRMNLNLENLHISHPQLTSPSSTGGVSQPSRSYMVSSQSFTGQESVKAGLDRMIFKA